MLVAQYKQDSVSLCDKSQIYALTFISQQRFAQVTMLTV